MICTRSIALLFILALSACSPPEMPRVPTPVLSDTPVRLRVAYAINPRFTAMTPAQIKIMLAESRRIVKEHFHVDIEFAPVQRMQIENLFKRIPKHAGKAMRRTIYNFKNSKSTPPRLVNSIERTLRVNPASLESMWTYAGPYLLQIPAERNYHSLAKALADTLLARIKQWTSLRAEDGRPVIDDAPYNEWVWWTAMGYGDIPFEVVLTNQLIASVEYADMDIHTALRGGISAGTTTYSKKSHYGAYIFWSTFPYSNRYEMLTRMRGGETYSNEEAARLAGAYLAHEIGHLLFHFGHPFGEKACVMNPVRMLHFRDWFQSINAKQCPVGSNESMKPGALSFHYHPAW